MVIFEHEMATFEAVRSKNLAEVTRLIDTEETINCRLATDKNKTPLMLAIETNCLPIAKFLSDRGADLNCLDDEGSTALTYACRYEKFEIVQYLTEKGANVCKGENGNNPLLEAIKQSDFKTAKFLVKNGDVFSIHLGLVLASAMGKLDFVKMLLQNKAEVNYEIEGITAILCAAKRNHVDIAKILIEKGANVNFEEKGPKGGKTALLIAIKMNSLALVKLLVENGALINKEIDDTYPIIKSVQRENCKILQYLLQAGARFIDRSMQEILLNIAADNKDFVSIKCLIEAGIDCDTAKDRLERLCKENTDFALYFKSRRESWLRFVSRGLKEGKSQFCKWWNYLKLKCGIYINPMVYTRIRQRQIKKKV